MMRALRQHVALLAILMAPACHQGIGQEPPCVVYFGDSITEGWMDAVLAPALAFPHVCDSLLIAEGRSFHSAASGRAGETSRDAVARIDADVLSLHPNVVVIAYGSNDYYIHGYATAPRVAPGEFAANLRLLVKKVAGIGATPILCPMVPMLPDRFALFSPPALYASFGGAGVLQARYNSIVASIAAGEGAPILSLEFGDEAERAGLLGIDGVHPTAAGHRRIAAELARIIAPLLTVWQTPMPLDDAVDVFPNPLPRAARHYLSVRFMLESAAEVVVDIHALDGRRVRRIVHSAFSSGKHYIAWDGTTDQGGDAGAGMFIATITLPRGVIRKIIVLE